MRRSCPSCQTGYDDGDTRFCGRCGSDLARAVAADSLLGRVIDGRYRVLDKLGQGGMGTVYRVEHLAMGKMAAMKLLHPALSQDPELTQRFRREAEAVSRLSSPNTVQVFDFGCSEGALYLVMELVKGEDLGALLRREGPLFYERLAPIAMQICDALAEAHEAGIIHRDLKPENVLITRTRSGHDLVKVLDFGLAQLRDSTEPADVTVHGALVGTPFYMSPEQIRSEPLDARSDLYALGALLYRLLTGAHPFSAPTPVAVLTQHLTAPLVPPSQRRPQLSAGVDALISKALAKRKEDRFPSADAFKQALAESLASPSQPYSQSPADAFQQALTSPSQSPADAFQQALTSPSHSPADAFQQALTSPSRSPAELRRSSDSAAGTPSSLPPLRRADFDAYERALKRRRWFGLSVVPLGLILGAAAFVVFTRVDPEARVRPYEREPNNSPAMANPLSSGRPVKGQLGKRISLEQSDRDFYRLWVPGRTPMTLRAQLSSLPNMDLMLEVFDAKARKEAEADAGRPGQGELIPNLRLLPGEHYLAVRQVWVAGEPAIENVSDFYTLTATWAPISPGWETEPDDTPAMALPLLLGQTMRGYLNRGIDVDYWLPQGTGGGTMEGDVTGVPGVDLRVVVLPAGALYGPPGPLPPGTQLFDRAGAGLGESIRGVRWPLGTRGPLIVVEAKPEPTARPDNDPPYALTVRLSP